MARASSRSTSSNRGRKSNRGRSVSAKSILARPLQNIDLRRLNGGGYKRVIRGLSDRPVWLSIAGSVGAFFLGRFLYRYYQNHPEISEFIQDNFNTVEEKLREFRGGDINEDVARH